MGPTRGHRRFLSDLAYKWTPLGFVAFLFIVCTALLSVSGKLSHAEVVGFCATAGLLVAFFAICHLVLYYTTIKDQMDLEKNQGDSSTASSSSRPGRGAPASHHSRQSAEVHRQPQGLEQQPAQQNRDENGQQVSLGVPNHPSADVSHNNHPPRAQPNANTQVRDEDTPDEEQVRPPLRVVNEVRRNTLSTGYVRPHMQRSHSHNSAAPEPLSVRTRQAGYPQGGGVQREYKPYRRPDPKTPSHPPHPRQSRDIVDGVSSLYTAGLTPEEAMDSVHRTMGRQPWSNSRDRPPTQQRRYDQSPVSYQGDPRALVNVPPGHRSERRLWPSSSPNSPARPSSRWGEVTNQAGSQNRAFELSADSVQGYMVLLQEPDLVDLLARRHLELKPRPCLLDGSGGGGLEKPLTRRDDTDVVILDNPERKLVQVHDSPITVEGMRSQRAQVQHSTVRRSRRSADSGYGSVDRLRRSISTPQLHMGGRSSAASSSSGDSRSLASLERQSSSN